MITFMEGNIFDSPAQVLTNPVNCVGVMGKGLAHQFKIKFPTMFEDYQEKVAHGKIEPGSLYLWEDDRTQILIFPTKKHWKGRSRLEYIDQGLKYLAEHYTELCIFTIAMPALGCGEGGLDWSDVRNLMERYLAPISDLEVFTYLPRSAGLLTDSEQGEIVTVPRAIHEQAARSVRD